jgi:hypothetical protein
MNNNDDTFEIPEDGLFLYIWWCFKDIELDGEKVFDHINNRCMYPRNIGKGSRVAYMSEGTKDKAIMYTNDKPDGIVYGHYLGMRGVTKIDTEFSDSFPNISPEMLAEFPIIALGVAKVRQEHINQFKREATPGKLWWKKDLNLTKFWNNFKVMHDEDLRWKWTRWGGSGKGSSEYFIQGRIIHKVKADNNSKININYSGEQLNNPYLDIAPSSLDKDKLKVIYGNGSPAEFELMSLNEDGFFTIKLYKPGDYIVEYDHIKHTLNSDNYPYNRGGNKFLDNSYNQSKIILTSDEPTHINVVIGIHDDGLYEIRGRIINGNKTKDKDVDEKVSGEFLNDSSKKEVKIKKNVKKKNIFLYDGETEVHDVDVSLDKGYFVISRVKPGDNYKVVVKYKDLVYSHLDISRPYNRGGNNQPDNDSPPRTITIKDASHINVVIDLPDKGKTYQITGRVIDGEGDVEDNVEEKTELYACVQPNEFNTEESNLTINIHDNNVNKKIKDLVKTPENCIGNDNPLLKNIPVNNEFNCSYELSNSSLTVKSIKMIKNTGNSVGGVSDTNPLKFEEEDILFNPTTKTFTLSKDDLYTYKNNDTIKKVILLLFNLERKKTDLTITGRVIDGNKTTAAQDSTGEYLNNIKSNDVVGLDVKVLLFKDGVSISNINSDKNGKFIFNNVAAGDGYQINLEYDGEIYNHTGNRQYCRTCNEDTKPDGLINITNTNHEGVVVDVPTFDNPEKEFKIEVEPTYEHNTKIETKNITHYKEGIKIRDINRRESVIVLSLDQKHSLPFSVKCIPGGDGVKRFSYRFYAMYYNSNTLKWEPFSEDEMKQWDFQSHGQMSNNNSSNKKEGLGRFLNIYHQRKKKIIRDIKFRVPLIGQMPYASNDAKEIHISFTSKNTYKTILIGLNTALKENKSGKTLATGTGYYIINFDKNTKTNNIKETGNIINLSIKKENIANISSLDLTNKLIVKCNHDIVSTIDLNNLINQGAKLNNSFNIGDDISIFLKNSSDAGLIESAKLINDSYSNNKILPINDSINFKVQEGINNIVLVIGRNLKLNPSKTTSSDFNIQLKENKTKYIDTSKLNINKSTPWAIFKVNLENKDENNELILNLTNLSVYSGPNNLYPDSVIYDKKEFPLDNDKWIFQICNKFISIDDSNNCIIKIPKTKNISIEIKTYLPKNVLENKISIVPTFKFDFKPFVNNKWDDENVKELEIRAEKIDFIDIEQTSISQDEQHLLNIASKASDQLQPEITDLSKILEFSQKLRRHITSAQQSKARFSVFTSLKEVHDRIDAPSAKLKQLEKEIKPELIKIHEDLSKTVEKDNSALSSIKAEFQSKVNFISEAQQIDSTLGIMTQACNTRNLKLKQILTFFSQLEEGFKKADNTNKELKEKLKEKHQNINLVTDVIQQFNLFIHELESILGKLNSIEEAFKEVQNIASRYNLVQNFNKIQTRLSSYQKAA